MNTDHFTVEINCIVNDLFAMGKRNTIHLSSAILYLLWISRESARPLAYRSSNLFIIIGFI